MTPGAAGSAPATRARRRREDSPPPPTPEEKEQFERVWSSLPGLLGRIREVNNIPIAQRYMATGFAFFLIGGAMALLMRIQLGTPENTFLDAETYNQLFTMHGTTMMFLFVIPFIEAIANYLMPLILGTRDLPFPRLTALSYWTYVFGGIFLFSSFLFGVAPDGGWFAYPPLTSEDYSPAINMDYWDIGLSVAEVAAMGAAAELIVAILRVRAPGMSLNRLPVFAWAMLVTAVMIIFAFTPLIVGTAMLELDRKELTAFFDPTAGGEPLLWQHLFWVFGHPEVYIMFLPAVGIVTHVVQVFSRRPIVSYTLVVLAIIATGFISFGLWVHHMFTTGLSWTAMGFFTAASLMIAIPNGVQFFSWIATLWSGRPVWRTPLLFVMAFLVTFLLGGVTGVMVAAVPFDAQVHDTYFVVAHFHYVLIGGVLFPLFAGLYYWLPKITGRLLSERLGRWNAGLMFLFFNVAFFPMHISGLNGMPRRVYTYEAGTGLDVTNLISTIGALGFAAATLLFVVNVVWSFRKGAKAGADPWGADGLEWSQDSPPPQAQYARIPVVRSRHPLWEQRTMDPKDPALSDVLVDLDHRPTGWRGALVVSALEARPLAIVCMPGASIWPFTMAISFVFLFAGLLLDNLTALALGAVGTMVSLVGWFWPMKEVARAIEEIGTEGRSGRLPLAVAGPLANGWWGTLVLIAVLATALVTWVASYFYLGEGPDASPPEIPGRIGLVLVATLLALGAWGGTLLTTRAFRRERPRRARVPLIATVTLTAVFLAVVALIYGEEGIEPSRSAYGSAFAGLLGWQWLVSLIVLAMTAAALLWQLRSPLDERGHAVAHNAALVTGFAAVNWLVVAATLYASPRLL